MITTYDNYRKIDPVPFRLKRVLKAEQADIVLQIPWPGRKDIPMCNFLALGFYGLYRSMHHLKNDEVKVCFASGKYFEADRYNSTICTNGEKYSVPANALRQEFRKPYINELLAYVAGEHKNNNLLAFLAYLEITSYVNGINYTNRYAKILPGEFRLRDVIYAQEVAYQIIAKALAERVDI